MGSFSPKRHHARNLPALCPDHMPKVARPFHELAHTLPKVCRDLARTLTGPRPRLPSRATALAAPVQCFADLARARPSLCYAVPWQPAPHFTPPGALTSGRIWGRDRIGVTWAESQWIVAARPLCHLQYPVAYLSRLQRILPAARWEFLQGVPCDSSAARVSPTTRAFGGRGPYCWSANGRRAHASLLARILT